MGTFIRWFWGLILGRAPYSRKYLSEVSKTIDALPFSKRFRWFWGGALHMIPVIIVLALLFGLRVKEIKHDNREIIALLIALLWAWVGPALIWYYERYTLPLFAKRMGRVVRDEAQRRQIRDHIFSNIYELRICWLITVVWIVVVLAGFHYARSFIFDFGIRGYTDPLWWAFLAGAIFFAFYTSIGFCLAYKGAFLTYLIAKSNIHTPIYHDDQMLGLSFLGLFAFKTTSMFFSGWLFAPLIVLISQHRGAKDYTVTLLLLGIYFLFIAGSFAAHLYMTHKKIVEEKNKMNERRLQLADALVADLDHQFSEPEFQKLTFLRALIKDIQTIREWPLRLDVGLAFATSSILLPTVAGIMSAVLTR